MKRLIIVIALLLSSFIVTPVWADTDNFYFSDFTADYYLSKDSEGVSHLKVVENLTAEFPNFEQNKGITRKIPFLNQDGKNIVLPHLNKSDVILLRNGINEPIWNIEQSGDHYVLETGTDDYVLGSQTYTIEYSFEKVVTEFPTHQELYWDTNGNGWPQRFDSVTARVHFENDLTEAYTGNAWCYVGEYGTNDQTRCQIEKTFDGFEVVAGRLGPYENLTFDIEIKPGSFVVPEPEISYAVVIVTAIIGAIALAIVMNYYIKNREVREKVKKYKNMIVAPQYQPNSKYHLAEMAEIYLGKKKDAKVGILLGMIVDKKIELRKKDDAGLFKGKWELIVKDVSLLQPEEGILLKLLNAGSEVKNDDVIELKSQVATTSLISIGKSFDSQILNMAKNDNLVKSKYKLGNARLISVGNSISYSLMMTTLSVFTIWPLSLFIVALASGVAMNAGKYAVYEEECNLLLIIIVAVASFAIMWMSDRKTAISELTDEGLEASNYMEGLKLYIKMAEADRLKFLQSVEGADVSSKGIVKLYEKLLPYAAVFGLEESWMKEMKAYCEINEIDEPSYLLTGITAAELSNSMRSAASYASSSGNTIAGGGSFSSSSSGGGGGGFSGGGGGGGGGGGR